MCGCGKNTPPVNVDTVNITKTVRAAAQTAIANSPVSNALPKQLVGRIVNGVNLSEAQICVNTDGCPDKYYCYYKRCVPMINGG